MEHSFLDKYSNLDSLIHRLDPRVKIISFLVYIIFVVLTLPHNLFRFVAYLTVIFMLILLSKVPLGYILKRSCIIIPFVLLIAVFIPFFKEGEVAGGYSFGTLRLTVTYSGLWILWNVSIKSWLAVLAMITLSSTTRFPEVLKGFERLYVPKVLIMVLSFMYRYIFVLIDESMRMERARRSRYFGGEHFRQLKVFANMIGLLFIRTYERGERVYQSMAARGFNGEILTLSHPTLRRNDVLFLVIFLASLVMIKIGRV
ncbi:MAG TPA: cobalt ECF transporter T component CbiQ [Candidatus Latescibacteria bacterium]|nr:cobalt ECF transporter T component CbiQ [Candidatus Latescibacterota bacterium]